MAMGVLILKVRGGECALSIRSSVGKSFSSEVEAEGKICMLWAQVSRMWRKKQFFS